MAEMLLLCAAEPLQRQLFQDIGPEKLSLARLRREAQANGRDADDASVTTYVKFGFRLDWLEDVVAAFQLPDVIETDGGHIFEADEAVLLLLRRYRIIPIPQTHSSSSEAPIDKRIPIRDGTRLQKRDIMSSPFVTVPYPHSANP